jgi:hypothetical protein
MNLVNRIATVSELRRLGPYILAGTKLRPVLQVHRLSVPTFQDCGGSDRALEDSPNTFLGYCGTVRDNFFKFH